MYKKLLVPVDGSDPSNCGLMEAIKLARNQKATIRLLHVVDEHLLDAEYSFGTYEGDGVAAYREAGKKVLHDGASLVRQFGLEPESVGIESLIGKAPALIAAHAKAWGADLIVMGTHGRRGIKRLIWGSDAAAVVRETRIPILLVHDGSENTPEAQSDAVAPLAIKEYLHA